MKARIEVLLSLWGRWAIKRESGALGYPAQSCGFQEWQPPAGGVMDKVPMGFVSADIVAVDEAVKRLPDFPRIAVIRVYQHQRSMRQAGAEMGCDHKTVVRYIAMAHEQIALDIGNCSPHNPSPSDRVNQSALAEPAAAR